MSKLFSRIAVLMIASFFLMSCGISKTYVTSMESEYTNMFVGKSHNQIVSSLGAPDRQTSDGAGGTILIYEQVTTTSNSVATANNVNYFTRTYTPGVQTNTTTNTSFVHIYINNAGTCYTVKTNHQKVVTDVNEEKLAKVQANQRKAWKILGITSGSVLGVLGIILGCLSIGG